MPARQHAWMTNNHVRGAKHIRLPPRADEKLKDETNPEFNREYSSFFHAIEQFSVLKAFQNDLYLLTGLPFDFVDTGLRNSEQLRAYRVFTPFCTLVKGAPLGHGACECDERQIVANCVIKRKSVVRRCHLGPVYQGNVQERNLNNFRF